MGGVGVAFEGMNGDEVNLELNLNEPRLEAPEGLSAPAAQGRPPILPCITPLFTGLFPPILPVYLVWPVLGKGWTIETLMRSSVHTERYVCTNY